MEMAGEIWAVRKIRHMVDSAIGTIVFTDHPPILGIEEQTSLKTASSAKVNLRMIRASQFLSQFSLEARHKKERKVEYCT